MQFEKQETLYLSENESKIFDEADRLLETIADHANDPNIKYYASQAIYFLRAITTKAKPMSEYREVRK